MDSTMYYKGLELVIKDGVALVTMCNGDNKFSTDYVGEWNKLLDDVERNSEIKGLITTGKGRAFSTGLDVQWMKTQTPTALDHYHEELHALYKRILSLGVVTVAAVNGFAIAEGAFIALMHDFRLMRSDRGWIQWPEVHLKLPFTKTMVDLFRIKVSSGHAHREALVFGKRLDAKTAKALGIVDGVTSEETLLAEARNTIKTALGKMTLSQTFFNDMKTDMFNKYVADEKLISKL